MFGQCVVAIVFQHTSVDTRRSFACWTWGSIVSNFQHMGFELSPLHALESASLMHFFQGRHIRHCSGTDSQERSRSTKPPTLRSPQKRHAPMFRLYIGIHIYQSCGCPKNFQLTSMLLRCAQLGQECKDLDTRQTMPTRST